MDSEPTGRGNVGMNWKNDDDLLDRIHQSNGLALMKHIFMPLAGLAAAFAFLAPIPASSQEDPKTVIAAQVREQGHPCGTPESAERDETLSKPGETVWKLTCDDASYQVRLIPGMAADITKLD